MNPLKRFVKKLAPHRKEYYWDKLFRRVNEQKLAAALESVGIGAGQILYIQSSFGCMGYYPDGGNRFIKLLQNIIGPKGTIVMPCFPTSGAMADYVATDPVFNIKTTPSGIGFLPEVLRNTAGVMRSCHPTHSVVALGYLAEEIVHGHEKCRTPQGEGSPFDKLVRANARILRIGTPANPLTHRLQEVTNFPNLFLETPVELSCVNADGEKIRVKTLVYRKKIPFAIFLSDDSLEAPICTNLIDLPILFETRIEAYKNDADKRNLLPIMSGYKRTFHTKGMWKQTLFHDCVIDSYPGLPTMEFAAELVTNFINRHTALYDPEQVESGIAKGSIKL